MYLRGLLVSSFLLSPILAAAARADPVPQASGFEQVHYQPAPAWALPPMAQTPAPTPQGAPLRLVYSDIQVRLLPDRTETFSAMRAKVLSSQALALGSLRLEWNPSDQEVAVNSVRILRDGEWIDVLASNRFAVIQREANLEASMLPTVERVVAQVKDVMYA